MATISYGGEKEEVPEGEEGTKSKVEVGGKEFTVYHGGREAYEEAQKEDKHEQEKKEEEADSGHGGTTSRLAETYESTKQQIKIAKEAAEEGLTKSEMEERIRKETGDISPKAGAYAAYSHPEKYSPGKVGMTKEQVKAIREAGEELTKEGIEERGQREAKQRRTVVASKQKEIEATREKVQERYQEAKEIEKPSQYEFKIPTGPKGQMQKVSYERYKGYLRGQSEKLWEQRMQAREAITELAPYARGQEEFVKVKKRQAVVAKEQEEKVRASTGMKEPKRVKGETAEEKLEFVGKQYYEGGGPLVQTATHAGTFLSGEGFRYLTSYAPGGKTPTEIAQRHLGEIKYEQFMGKEERPEGMIKAFKQSPKEAVGAGLEAGFLSPPGTVASAYLAGAGVTRGTQMLSRSTLTGTSTLAQGVTLTEKAAGVTMGAAQTARVGAKVQEGELEEAGAIGLRTGAAAVGYGLGRQAYQPKFKKVSLGETKQQLGKVSGTKTYVGKGQAKARMVWQQPKLTGGTKTFTSPAKLNLQTIQAQGTTSYGAGKIQYKTPSPKAEIQTKDIVVSGIQKGKVGQQAFGTAKVEIAGTRPQFYNYITEQVGKKQTAKGGMLSETFWTKSAVTPKGKPGLGLEKGTTKLIKRKPSFEVKKTGKSFMGKSGKITKTQESLFARETQALETKPAIVQNLQGMTTAGMKSTGAGVSGAGLTPVVFPTPQFETEEAVTPTKKEEVTRATTGREEPELTEPGVTYETAVRSAGVEMPTTKGITRLGVGTISRLEPKTGEDLRGAARGGLRQEDITRPSERTEERQKLGERERLRERPKVTPRLGIEEKQRGKQTYDLFTAQAETTRTRTPTITTPSLKPPITTKIPGLPFALPEGKRKKGKNIFGIGKPPEEYTPSLGGLFMEPIEEAPEEAVTGLELRPFVMRKGGKKLKKTGKKMRDAFGV